MNKIFPCLKYLWEFIKYPTTQNYWSNPACTVPLFSDTFEELQKKDKAWSSVHMYSAAKQETPFISVEVIYTQVREKTSKSLNLCHYKL